MMNHKKMKAMLSILVMILVAGCGKQEVNYQEVELITEETNGSGQDESVVETLESEEKESGGVSREGALKTTEESTGGGTISEKNPTEETTQEETSKEVVTEAVTAAPDGTIAGTPSWASIEADVSLSGSGTGFHAKLVMCTPTSAVSYGIQYDSCAAAPYTGKTMALVENIGSNNPGGQSYFRPGNVELQLDQSYHMMLTLNRDGSGSVYLDCNKIGDFYNPNLAYQDIVYLRVEGSGRKNGDSVYATFNNIRLKVNGTYQSGKEWGMHEFQQNPSIGSAAYSTSNIVISGYVSGIGDNEDWDSRYNDVSGIIQFIQ
ncbi:MAG: hypothetical protein ACI4AQ_02605 [Lachnospiraceae bacterium]